MKEEITQSLVALHLMSHPVIWWKMLNELNYRKEPGTRLHNVLLCCRWRRFMRLKFGSFHTQNIQPWHKTSLSLDDQINNVTGGLRVRNEFLWFSLATNLFCIYTMCTVALIMGFYKIREKCLLSIKKQRHSCLWPVSSIATQPQFRTAPYIACWW